MRVEKFPEPGAKVPSTDFIITGGGCAANAAVTIARLGGRANFTGPLGGPGDEVSNRIIAGLATEGIDCGGIVRVPGATASVSLILIDQGGEKTIATRRGSKLETALPANPRAQVAHLDALLIDNRFPEFVLPLCKAARARGIPVVIDLDRATRLDDPLLATGTHVIASAEAVRGTTGISDIAAALKRLGKQLSEFVAITDGPNGFYWLENGDVRHMEAFKVKAIDSLGAGDAFHGAFALGLAEGQTLSDAMRFASATAALKCTHFGGALGAPRRGEVDEFLLQHAA